MKNNLAVELADFDSSSAARQEQPSFFGIDAFRAWCNAYLPQENWKENALILSVRSRELLCQTVFGVQRFPGFEALSLGGYYWPYRSAWLAANMPPAEQDVVLGAIADRLVADTRWPVIRLGPVRSDDRFADKLMSNLRARRWTCLEKPVGTTWVVTVPPTAQHFELAWGKHLVDRVAYYTRRLNKTGNVRIECYKNLAPENWRKVCASCLAIEQNSWVAKNGGDTKFSGQRNATFWQSLFASPDGTLVQIWILYVGETPVAFSLNLDIDGTRHIIANTYDDGFKANSPGTILTAHVLKDTLTANIHQVDWGAGDSGYKQRWGASEGTQLTDRIAIRPGARGWLLGYALRKRGGYA